MKKYFGPILLAVAVVAAGLGISSCAVDVDNVFDSLRGYTDCTINANIQTTKTLADEGGKLTWEGGDALTAVIVAPQGGNPIVREFTYNTDDNTFHGSAPSSVLSSSYNWYLTYPSNSSISSVQSIVNIAEAQTQTGNTNLKHIKNELSPLYGVALNNTGVPSVTMQHVSALLRFKLTNESAGPVTVKEVLFTSEQNIVGKFTADLTKETITWAASGNNGQQVKLTVNEGASIAAGEGAEFTAAVIPFTVPAGGKIKVKVTAVDANNQTIPYYVTYSLANGKEFTAGVRSSINVHFDANHQTDEEQPSTISGYTQVNSEPSDWSGKYIMVSPDKNFIFTGATGTSNKYALQASDWNGEAIVKNCDDYVFEISKVGNNYYLKHNGQYLYCSYTDGDGNTGLAYSTSQQPLNLEKFSDGTFGFWMTEQSTQQYFYYKSSDGYFKMGHSYGSSCVYLYKYSEGGVTPVDPTTVEGYQQITSEPSDWSGDYVMVSADKSFIFTGDNGTSNKYQLQSSDWNGDIITKDCAQYVFNISKSGNNYYLKHNNQYLYCSYSGNSSTGMAYSSSQQAMNLTMLSNSNFGFWMHEGNYDQYIYYKTADNTNYFKFGGSNNGQGVLLYKYSKGSVTPGPGPDEPTTQSFVKVTSTPSSWDGTYLVVDEASGKAFSFDGTNYAINVTITDGKIALTDQTQHAAVTVSDAGVKHANNTSYEAYDVKTSTGKFVYYSNGAIVIGDTNTKTESSTTYYYYHTFMLDNNGVQMMSGRHSNGSSKYYIRYNNNAFGYQQGGTSNRVQLYKLSGSVTPVTPDDPDDPQTGDYAKVTSEPSSWAGTYLIVDEASQKVFMPFEENAPNFAYSVTINNGVISANADLSKYAVTITDAGSNHNNSHLSGQRAYDVKNSAGYYIFWSSDFGDADAYIHVKSTNTVVYSGTTYTYHHAFKIINGGVQLVSAIDLADGNAYYLGYSNGAFSYTDDSSRRVQLYKLNGSVTPPTPGKTDQNLSFSNSSVTWKIGSGYTMGSTYSMPQTVSGAKTSVTYTSSNTSVATIVNNNQIKIAGYGSTSITASAASDATYNAASAAYTLVISTDGIMVYNLENDKVSQYLDKVAETPYNTSDYSYTYVSSYYSGTGQNNRLDWPKPVSLTWTGNGATTVTIYTNSSMTNVEWSQSVSGNSADIYNLVPGQHYYYKVTSSNGQVASGEFETTGRRRMIRTGAGYGTGYANNCRDFGGQVTTSGKTLKYKLMYRGSNMDNTTSDQKDLLKNYLNVQLDVDLRESSGRNPLSVTVSDQNYNSFNDLSNTSRIKVTISDILNAVINDKVVYIHCAVGADRTGYVCMLLEAILGVPQERCDIDYELTSFAGAVGARPRTTGWTSSNYYYSSDGVGVNFINQQTGSTFQEKAVNYVVNTLGISRETVTAFQNKMLQ